MFFRPFYFLPVNSSELSLKSEPLERLPRYQLKSTATSSPYVEVQEHTSSLVQEGKSDQAGGKRDIVCTVSFFTFLDWWVIFATLH